jgi:uncharacterized membrane protein YhhN
MRALVLCSVVTSCAFLAVSELHFATDTALPVVLKVGSIALLALLAVLAHPRRRLLIAALLFSAAGDYFLAIKHLASLGPAQLFLAGLVSFFIAHLFYIALFAGAKSRASVSPTRVIASLATVIVAATSMFILWPGLAEMRSPVLAYSFVLTAMVIAVQFSRYSAAVAVGALCFLASDTMLALSIFGHPFRASQILVWIAYYAAQLTITFGVMATPKRFTVAA